MSDLLSVVIVSNKVRYSNTINKYLNPNVLLLQYRYDIGYDGIINLVANNIGTSRIQNLAIILYSTPFAVYICSNDGKMQQFSYDFLNHSQIQANFFKKLNLFFDLENENNCRIDFFSCNIFNFSDINDALTELKKSVSVTCSISKEVWGSDVTTEDSDGLMRTVSEIYFSVNNFCTFTTHQTINGFEKIRTVGKGAYGTAVLYRKRDDDSLVILKEINMHDLSATERQFAMNEVKVLSQLDHPNIVAYFDSFEEDGVLMIEMEYAENGTLSQFLSIQEKALEEKKILEMFHQIVSAIHYIHERKILHRDLKTVNIFLTKEEIIKVGDFGISKMLSTTHEVANSVIGTPYYISPEMCQGKVYNEKSDVWALGCILYEMTCLHKTFEGSNLPALVNKILKGHFEPVKGSYSDELKELISSLLQKNPDDRLSTELIIHQKLPMMMKKFQANKSEESDITKRQTRSVIYIMDVNTLHLSPVRLPSKIRIKQVCNGENHTIVLTTDRTVYTWGSNEFGQLGHGDLIDRKKPELVLSLTQKSVLRIACGNNFSVFGPENGIIMTCGCGISGSLGHGDFKDILKPKLIESLLIVDIVCICATNSHVVVVSSEGVVYVWGSNKNGQLGFDNLVLYCSPQKVTFEESISIRNAFTSEDATMLLTDTGSLLASGNNYGNKLGLNARLGFLMTMNSFIQQPTVNSVHEFTPIKSLMRHRVVQVSMGKNHTIIICESGKVISFGINSDGQLGNGHTKSVSFPCEVKTMKRQKITKVVCGSTFSVACANFNSLYFWGKRQVQKSAFESCNEDETINKSLGKEKETNEQYFQSTEENHLKPTTRQSSYLEEISEPSNEVWKVHATPIPILHLKNPKNDCVDKELICLTDCITYQDYSLLVQIETTAPAPKRRSKTLTRIKKQDSLLFKDEPEATNSFITDPSITRRFSIKRSSNSTISYEENDRTPTWIKKELIEAATDIANICSIKNSSKSVTFENNVSKPSLRIYTSDQDTQNSTMSPRVSFKNRDLLKTPNQILSINANRESQLEQAVSMLQNQIRCLENELEQTKLLNTNLQKEIEILKTQRKITYTDDNKTSSTVCLIQ